MRFLFVTAALIALTVVASAGLTRLWQADHDADALRLAEQREARCERGWHVTNTRVSELRAAVDEHLAIEEDGPCVCAVMP